jgi:SAM-dependent MidA family methyltransferase
VSSLTSLGMPAVPPPTAYPTWKQAWDTALYGAAGFYRRESAAAHFRTSVHASTLFAEAVARLTREAGLDTVVDIGAGRGELLVALHRIDPGLQLLGVEVASRPAGLPRTVAWTTALPEDVEGVVVANEWLDNIPCHVVEVDADGVPRVVHVDPDTGEEALGQPITHASVPASVRGWLERWWPVDRLGPGARAEVGTTRDAAWADVVRRVSRGITVAVDYGHRLEDRPAAGSLASYRHGARVDVVPDGTRDVTAHVAVDTVAAAVGGEVRRQRDALLELGVDPGRPALSLATEEPAAYLRRLSSAGEAAELTATGGLGDFWWVSTVS